MYQSAHSAEHSYEEHVAIVDALEARGAKAAVKLMQEHLHHVERNLRLVPRIPDFHSALRPERRCCPPPSNGCPQLKLTVHSKMGHAAAPETAVSPKNIDIEHLRRSTKVAAQS